MIYFFLQIQHQGVPGNQYNMVDNTNTEHYLPTDMSLGGQPTLSNTGCLVLVSVDQWNHLISDDFNQIFPIG